jgi:hypothetical protein
MLILSSDRFSNYTFPSNSVALDVEGLPVAVVFLQRLLSILKA